MITSFDSLSAIGTELTSDQLDDVDGGILLFILGLAVGIAIGYEMGSNS